MRLPPEQPSLAYADDTSHTSGILTDAVVLLTRLTEGGTPGFVAVRRPISLSANGLMNILEAVAAGSQMAMETEGDKSSRGDAWLSPSRDTGTRVHRLERTLRGDPQLLAFTQKGDCEQQMTETQTPPENAHVAIRELPQERSRWSLRNILARLSLTKEIDAPHPMPTSSTSTRLQFDNIIEESDFKVLQSPEDMVRYCDTVSGRDMQGFDLSSPRSRMSLRSRRRRNLAQQLDQTRRFMRRYHPRLASDETSPALEVLSCRRRDAIVDWAENSTTVGVPRLESIFKLRVFHRKCSPSFDHFQLKRLMVGDKRGGFFYLEQFPKETPDDVSSFYTPSNDLFRGDRSAVFHFDTTHAKKRRALGPWMFPSVRQLLSNGSQGHLWSMASVSLDSPCIYSIAASRHFLVAADSSSSLIIARMSPDHSVAWAVCQRSSQQPLQITNCIQIIEDSTEGIEMDIDRSWKILRPQAEARGVWRLERAGKVLEGIIPSVRRHYELSLGFKQWRNWQLLSRPQLEEPAIPSEPLRRVQIPTRRFHAVRRRQTMDDVASFPLEPAFVQSADIRITEMALEGSRQNSRQNGSGRLRDSTSNCPVFSPWLDKTTGKCHYSVSEETADVLPSLKVTLLTASNDKQVSEYTLRYALVPDHVSVDPDTRCVPVKEGFATALPLTDTRHVAPVLDLKTKWDLPYCCNHIAIHPHKDLLLFVGDDPNSMIFSRKLGSVPQSAPSRREAFLYRQGTSNFGQNLSRPLFIVEGHHDCGFAADWHPNGFMFATGNDDETLMLWDLRYLRGPQKVYSSETTAPRSLHFSPNGSFLVSCESEDSVVIYDVRGGFECRQVIPFFGACTGAVFSADSETLFLGVAAPQGHGGIIELHLDNELT